MNKVINGGVRNTRKDVEELIKASAADTDDIGGHQMNHIVDVIMGFILLLWWIAGFVLAKGFWSTLFCLFTPYAYFLVVEKIFIFYGVINV